MCFHKLSLSPRPFFFASTKLAVTDVSKLYQGRLILARGFLSGIRQAFPARSAGQKRLDLLPGGQSGDRPLLLHRQRAGGTAILHGPAEDLLRQIGGLFHPLNAQAGQKRPPEGVARAVRRNSRLLLALSTESEARLSYKTVQQRRNGG